MASSHPFPTPLLHSPVNEKYDASLGRRTSATLQDNTAWNYSYNQRSEITSAIRKNASNVTQNNMRYVFDNIGNRTSSYEDATSKTYDANSLNQYTEIDVTGGSSVCPLYDDDGNMTQYGDWTYTYDAENRLVGALNGNTRLEYIYDALGRRVAKKLYQYNSLSRHERYVYDGMKLLATYNAKSSFAKINSFLWQPFGLDVPLIMTYNSTVYGYLVDANKNVLGLFNPSKTRVATYLYGPFGQKLSESGTIAANNPLQFSSEQFDADLSLVYYNFRYYFPNIGKWLTKDPIGEMGGWNLYAFCGNNAVNTWDENGEFEWGEMWDDFTYKVGHAVEIVDDAIGGHFEDISNFAAGMADQLSGGGTDQLRNYLNINDTVDHQSSVYKMGSMAGDVIDKALMVAGGIALGKQIIKCGIKNSAITLLMMGATQEIDGLVAPITNKLLCEAMNNGYINQTEAEMIQTGVAASGTILKYLGYLRSSKQICFAAGTPVLMGNGTYKKIEDVCCGDEVASYNETTGLNTIGKVIRLYRNKTKTWYKIVLSSGEICATPNHPFYTNNHWIAAKELKKGMIIKTHHGITEIIDVNCIELDLEENTYNFTTIDCHTYFVGKDACLVHNKCGVFFDSAKEAEKAANALGFEKTNYYVQNRPVFYNRNTGDYITPDNTGHGRGVWKIAKKIKKLASKQTRTATCDENLKIIRK